MDRTSVKVNGNEIRVSNNVDNPTAEFGTSIPKMRDVRILRTTLLSSKFLKLKAPKSFNLKAPSSLSF